MKVIFHNDDFGLSYGFTQAIVDSYSQGLTTSTCIRTNGTAFDYASGLVNASMKKIGMGLHLDITEGPTHLNELANNKGHYRYSYPQYYWKLKNGDRKLLKAIEKEFIYQFEMIFRKNLKIDHINSQDHIHMIPPVFELTCKLANKYRVKNIRLVNEPYHFNQNFSLVNHAKWGLLTWFSKQNTQTLKKYNLQSSNAFYGLLNTNRMTYQNIMNALVHAGKKNYKVVEILSHPVMPDKRDIIYSSPFIKKYSQLPERIDEYNAMQNTLLKKFVEKNKIELVSYKDI